MNKRTITAALAVAAAAAFVPATLASTAGAVARYYQGSQYSAAVSANEPGTATGESPSLLAAANAALMSKGFAPSVKTATSSPANTANEQGTATGESPSLLAAANAALMSKGFVPSVEMATSSPASTANEPGTATGESGPELAAANASLLGLGK